MEGIAIGSYCCSRVLIVFTLLVSRFVLCKGLSTSQLLERADDVTTKVHQESQLQQQPRGLRSLSKNDNANEDFACFNSNQACLFLNIYNNGTCPWTRQFCPPPQPPGDNAEATCLSVGKFCRTEYICNYNAITEDCCGDCQSYVVNCCPQWCNSCVPTSIRCDLYNYFANAGSDRTTLIRFKMYYETTLCVPKQLSYRCDDKTQATLFCRAYIASDSQSTSTTVGYSFSNRCLKHCIEVVSNPKFCPCQQSISQ
jgi:hypothetical protein